MCHNDGFYCMSHSGIDLYLDSRLDGMSLLYSLKWFLDEDPFAKEIGKWFCIAKKESMVSLLFLRMNSVWTRTSTSTWRSKDRKNNASFESMGNGSTGLVCAMTKDQIPTLKPATLQSRKYLLQNYSIFSEHIYERSGVWPMHPSRKVPFTLKAFVSDETNCSLQIWILYRQAR